MTTAGNPIKSSGRLVAVECRSPWSWHYRDENGNEQDGECINVRLVVLPGQSIAHLPMWRRRKSQRVWSNRITLKVNLLLANQLQPSFEEPTASQAAAQADMEESSQSSSSEANHPSAEGNTPPVSSVRSEEAQEDSNA